jgi:hypothetical protein
MQPGYIPWLGFFELMHNCDAFVLLDDVQYTHKDWRSRNRIRTKEGCMWLTVPVLTKGRAAQKIADVKINNTYPWRDKHFNALTVNYRRSKYYKQYMGFFEQIYKRDWDFLVDLDIEIINFMAGEFDIKTPVIRSSSLPASGSGGNTHILEICNKLGADELYDSARAKAFIDTELFKNSGIKLIFQDYKHPIYAQVYKPFMPHMSALDLLFNEGSMGRDIMLTGSAKGA